MRKPFADLRERVMLGYGSIRKPVETAAGAHQHSAPHQAQQILARDSGGFYVARANDAEALCESRDAGFGRLLEFVIRFSFLWINYNPGQRWRGVGIKPVTGAKGVLAGEGGEPS